MCCFVVIAMILDNQTTIGNQKDSIISLYISTPFLYIHKSVPSHKTQNNSHRIYCFYEEQESEYAQVFNPSLLYSCLTNGHFKILYLFTSLHGCLWEVYPDHLTRGVMSLARAEVTRAVGTLGRVRPRVQTGRRDWSWDERGNKDISQRDRLWISSSSDAEIIFPYWSLYGRDIIFPFCQLCIPLLPNLLQLR